MPFRAPPSTACWQHREARSGFEVAYFQAAGSGWIIEGTTAAVEDGQTWVVTYRIELDAAWVTRTGAHRGQDRGGIARDPAGVGRLRALARQRRPRS